MITDFNAAKDYAADYLRTYFMGAPTPDDRALLTFLAARYPLLKDCPVLLEVGCGPVINHILSAAPHVSAIHMADYRDDTLQQIELWKNGDPTAHNWNRFTRYVLGLEQEGDPTDCQVAEREALMKSRITKLFHCDLKQSHPLGTPKQYPAVACFYTTEQASSTLDEWCYVMKNLASLVAPGGDLLTCALGDCDYYILYGSNGQAKKYPVPKVTVDDFRGALTDTGFSSKDIVIEYQKLEGQEAEGVLGVILVHAYNKRA